MNSQIIFSKCCKHFDSFKQVMNHQEKLEVTWNTYFETVSFDHYENTKPVQKSTFEIGIDWVLNGSWAKYLLDLLQFPDTNLMSKGKIDSRVFSVCYLLITSIILQTVFSKKITSLMTSNIFPPYFLWIPLRRNWKRAKILQAENNVLKEHITTSIILYTVFIEYLYWCFKQNVCTYKSSC